MDQGWIKSEYIRGDVLEPFPGSGMAIWGRHSAPNVADLELPEPLMAANALFMAFWGCFEPFRSPLMAMSEGKKIPTYQHVCPLS